MLNVSVVLTSDISNISISISTRRTEDFDTHVLVCMLQLSSLRHKTHYAYVIVRTRLSGSQILCERHVC